MIRERGLSIFLGLSLFLRMMVIELFFKAWRLTLLAPNKIKIVVADSRFSILIQGHSSLFLIRVHDLKLSFIQWHGLFN